MGKYMRSTPEVILKRCVEDTDGCLIWQGKVDKDGYPKSTFVEPDGSKLYRAANALLKRLGKDINGKCVYHTCHNRLCLNPKHLKLVDSIEWIRKKTVKQKRHAIGSRQAAAFLTEAEVFKMKRDRELGMSWKDLADKYGYASRFTVRQAVTKFWKHVEV